MALTDEQVKQRLRLTEADLEAMDRIVDMENPDGRHSMAQLGVLKLKAQMTVVPPPQEVTGEVGVRVVVQTMKREGYEVPAGTATVMLPARPPDGEAN